LGSFRHFFYDVTDFKRFLTPVYSMTDAKSVENPARYGKLPATDGTT